MTKRQPKYRPAPAMRTVKFVDIQDALVREYAKARQSDNISQRWVNAIDRAWDFFRRSELITYNAETGELLYPSESSQQGVTYHANGTCQCEAFKDGQPCKHRAAARLLSNALKAK